MPVNWGSLRVINPVSRDFGYDRGTPVDRYYIEKFLEANSDGIRGRVLEIGDDSYTRQFGGAKATVRDILHVHSGNPRATIIGDLATGGTIPSNTFDCAILTQTLHLIYDVRAAIRTVYRMLKPGGIVLATVPGVSPIARDEWAETWYWCFTRHSVRRMFEEVFGPGAVEMGIEGNALASTCFLQGIALEDIRAQDLDVRNESHDFLFTVRAVKAE
jgi:SAM-dependent methyltransferase